MAEIKQKPQLIACGMKVIVYLRLVSIIYCNYRLQFYNYLPKAYEVCFISLLQFYTIILYLKFFLPFVRNSFSLELNLKCLLINSFKEAWAKGIVHLKCCTYYLIAFFLIDNHCFF